MTPLRTVVLTLLVLLASTAPAVGASRLVVSGAGFGHGVGLSPSARAEPMVPPTARAR